MDAALHLLDTGLEALRHVDTALLSADRLGVALLRLQKHLDGVTVAHAKLMHEAEKAGTHANSGHRDIASWLAANGKSSMGAAKRQQKLGEALNKSAALDDAVTSGEITPDTANALLPTLGSNHSGDEGDLIDACKGATPADAKDAGTLFQEIWKPDGETDAEREAKKRARRFFTLADDGDGMTRLSGLLPVADARAVQDALDSITGCWPRDVNDDRTIEQKNADALVEIARAVRNGSVGGGRETSSVMVVIDIDVLEGRVPGAGYTDKGDIFPAEIVRRMCTNANIIRLLTAGSQLLDLGRSQRLASDHQYRALLARDGGCRIPGCRIPAKWCEVDHIREWNRQHGDTNIDWLVLLCVFHHHLRHLPGHELLGDANNLRLKFPDGHVIDLPATGPATRRTG